MIAKLLWISVLFLTLQSSFSYSDSDDREHINKRLDPSRSFEIYQYDQDLSDEMVKALVYAKNPIHIPPEEWDSALVAVFFTAYGYFVWIGNPDLPTGAQWASFGWNTFILYAFAHRRLAVPISEAAERFTKLSSFFEKADEEARNKLANGSRLMANLFLSASFAGVYRGLAAWDQVYSEVQDLPFWIDVATVTGLSFIALGPLKTFLQKLETRYARSIPQKEGSWDESQKLLQAPLRRRDVKFVQYILKMVTLGLRPLMNQGSLIDEDGSFNWDIDPKKLAFATYAFLGTGGWHLLSKGEDWLQSKTNSKSVNLLQALVDRSHKTASALKNQVLSPCIQALSPKKGSKQ